MIREQTLPGGVIAAAFVKRMNEDVNRVMAVPDGIEKFDQFGAGGLVMSVRDAAYFSKGCAVVGSPRCRIIS